MLYLHNKTLCLLAMISVIGLGWQTAPAQHDHDHGGGEFLDLAELGDSHGSHHTGDDGLVGGRTAITTEAVLAYNQLRHFVGLDHATIDEIGTWAFANTLTNNTQAWGNDRQGVGIWYAMQGAKVGWMADETFDPQVVCDITRTARLGSREDVMAMVLQYGHEGFAQYLTENGYEDTFINTLKMEPHYAGWMHDRCHGWLSIEGVAIAHDVNHLTVLSHDQMQPFMNDTWDWPQWPALNVSHARVLEYFQSMVVLGDPLRDHLGDLGDPPINEDPNDSSEDDVDDRSHDDGSHDDGAHDGGADDDSADDDGAGDDPKQSGDISVEVAGELWWDGFTAAITVHNDSDAKMEQWQFRFASSHTISGTPWGCTVETTDLGNGFYEHLVRGAEWGRCIPAGGAVYVGFNGDQGAALGNSGLLDADSLFDGGLIGEGDSDGGASDPSSPDGPTETARVSVEVEGDLWWDGFTAAIAVHNETDGKLRNWHFRFVSSHRICGTPWGCRVETTNLGNGLYEHCVKGAEWARCIPAGGSVFVGFNGDQGVPLGNSGFLDADSLFDGGWIGD
ncbi:MAG: cellulose binding domain-containing protein [Planctomycetota bacterium]|nr:cellulose binding domain-containing protein [Planctomycetota bacterium]